MSHKDFGDTPSPGKEDAVREALGVEKKFEVQLSAFTTGIVHLNKLTVMAVDKEDAKKKAIELVLGDEVDVDGREPEEVSRDYEYDLGSEWLATIRTAD